MPWFGNGIQGSVSTNNDTITELARFAMDEQTVTVTDVQIAGLSLTGVKALWRLNRVIARITGNAVVMSDTINIFEPAKDSEAEFWDVALDVDGSDIVITVKGDTTNIIEWATFGPISGVILPAE